MAGYKTAAGVPRAASRVKEVAEAMGLSETATRQQIGKGNIPTVQVGGRVYIPAAFFSEVGLDEPMEPQGCAGAVRPETYAVAQVAATLGCSIPNVYQLTGRDVIPARVEGGKRLIPAEFFEEVGLEPPVLPGG